MKDGNDSIVGHATGWGWVVMIENFSVFIQRQRLTFGHQSIVI